MSKTRLKTWTQNSYFQKNVNLNLKYDCGPHKTCLSVRVGPRSGLRTHLIYTVHVLVFVTYQ